MHVCVRVCMYVYVVGLFLSLSNFLCVVVLLNAASRFVSKYSDVLRQTMRIKYIDWKRIKHTFLQTHSTIPINIHMNVSRHESLFSTFIISPRSRSTGEVISPPIGYSKKDRPSVFSDNRVHHHDFRLKVLSPKSRISLVIYKNSACEEVSDYVMGSKEYVLVEQVAYAYTKQ